MLNFVQSLFRRPQPQSDAGGEVNRLKQMRERTTGVEEIPAKAGIPATGKPENDADINRDVEIKSQPGGVKSPAARVGSESSARVGSESSARVGSESSARVGSESSARVGSESSARVGSESSTRVGSESSTRVGSQSSTRVGSESSGRVVVGKGNAGQAADVQQKWIDECGFKRPNSSNR